MPTRRFNYWMQVQLLLLAALVVVPASAGDDGFVQVSGPCGLSFPADHGPHPDYRTEWWYYIGNVTDPEGRAFGFQLTFFRSRLKPPADRRQWPQPASAWRSDQVYLAHAAVSDVAGGRHLQAERMARPVLGLAGAGIVDGTVTIDLHAWQAVIAPDRHRLRADDNRFALDVDLTPTKPPVRHGEEGYSRKGQAPERASCYYSFTRLQAFGTISVDGNPYQVSGSAWMDHEFSTAPLQPGITGWDWFSLQLSDQTELMIYRLRHPDGSINPASSGTYVLPSGQQRHLRRTDLQVESLSHWTSPHSNARYPIAWRITVAPLELSLTVAARLPDQEMRTPGSTDVTYWEGSVTAEGRLGKATVDGVGYVELTGYAKPFDAPM
jgi:predicted secreted hydrolase